MGVHQGPVHERALVGATVSLLFLAFCACSGGGSSTSNTRGRTDDGSSFGANLGSMTGGGGPAPLSSLGGNSTPTAQSPSDNAKKSTDKLSDALDKLDPQTTDQKNAIDDAKKTLGDLASTYGLIGNDLTSPSAALARSAASSYAELLQELRSAGNELSSAGYDGLGAYFQHMALREPVYQLHDKLGRHAYTPDLVAASIHAAQGTFAIDGIVFNIYKDNPSQVCDAEPLYECYWRTPNTFFLDIYANCTNPAEVSNLGIVGYICKTSNGYAPTPLHREAYWPSGDIFNTIDDKLANLAAMLGYVGDVVLGYTPY